MTRVYTMALKATRESSCPTAETSHTFKNERTNAVDDTDKAPKHNVQTKAHKSMLWLLYLNVPNAASTRGSTKRWARGWARCEDMCGVINRFWHVSAGGDACLSISSSSSSSSTSLPAQQPGRRSSICVDRNKALSSSNCARRRRHDKHSASSPSSFPPPPLLLLLLLAAPRAPISSSCSCCCSSASSSAPAASRFLSHGRRRLRRPGPAGRGEVRVARLCKQGGKGGTRRSKQAVDRHDHTSPTIQSIRPPPSYLRMPGKPSPNNCMTAYTLAPGAARGEGSVRGHDAPAVVVVMVVVVCVV